jgi:hypothetical protein
VVALFPSFNSIQIFVFPTFFQIKGVKIILSLSNESYAKLEEVFFNVVLKGLL